MTHYIANNTAKAMADAFAADIDAGSGAGKIKVYAGSVPADADASIGAATLLATLTFGDPSHGAATDAAPGGLITANAITNDSSADATGTAAFYRITDSDDNVVSQGLVGTSGANINFNTVSFVAGAVISITSLTHKMPES